MPGEERRSHPFHLSLNGCGGGRSGGCRLRGRGGSVRGRGYHRAVDDELDRIFEDARRTLSAPGRVALDPDYLCAIERLERRADVTPGADRTWVVETVRRAKQLLSHVELVS